ncbi:vacuolar atp synthase subunit [Cyclospora cayetanensis]|uniref:Vacuolar atp synthase subunit n=1 Tax=Cyclospora cayetanensis TaxID=88456 RepID=A0A1D3CR77_9EIME|nr:vacuolar atp synthase subunit [Cyclospora cayetanensis]
MAMDDKEALAQIQQMVRFILNEAKDKAQELEARALEDFNIEKLKLVQQMKDKIRHEFAKKAKKLEEQVVSEVYAQSQKQLAAISSNTAKYKELIMNLIVQGLLRLLEPEVIIRCREVDRSLVESVLSAAASKYSKILSSEAGLNKTVKLSVDKTGRYLPPPPSADSSLPSCCGGIVLLTPDGRISCDNTLDARLKMVVTECAPAIRMHLFTTPIKH